MEPVEYNQMFTYEDRHWWYRALRRQFRLELNRAGLPGSAGPDQHRGRFLDAGCGTGKTLSSLSEKWHSIGLDFSRQALELTRKRNIKIKKNLAKPSLLQASVEAIPIADDSLDLIISADVLYHRGVSSDVGALIEMKRCLRPGAVVMLNLPAFNWLYSEHDKAIHTARRYTRGEVEKKIVQAGLIPVRVRYWNWLIFAPLALVRLARKLLGGSGREDKTDGESQNNNCREQTETNEPKSDLYELPRPINELLDLLLRAETALASLPVPVGLSIIAVAQKPPKKGS